MSKMRVSGGEPYGRNVHLYHPNLFKEDEEVIVFTREEFFRNYTSMMEHIDFIIKKQLLLESSADWKLIGYWPQILEKIHLLNLNMEETFKKESLECYLDAYLFNTIKTEETGSIVSRETVSVKNQTFNMETVGKG